MDDSRKQDLAAFVAWSRKHITGDEKGEAQLFLDRLFQAFGQGGIREAGATLEMRIRQADNKGTAFADLVWKPVVLIEMKRRGEDLTRHYRQAFDYWTRLVPGRPRYAVLCNFDEFWVYDFETQMDTPVDTVTLAGLPERYGPLNFLFPTRERPVFGNDHEAVTRDAADKLAACFNKLIARNVDRAVAQKFTLQMLVALFAEDIGLMDRYFVTNLLADCKSPTDSYDLLGGLFEAMNSPITRTGGRFKGVPYFNGGLFAAPARVELHGDELAQLRAASNSDWSKVRPEIFGTLFEHSLDKSARHAFGQHFTSPVDIMKIVGPTIVEPWRSEIENATTLRRIRDLHQRMQSYTVLDPACGSGNFLYIAYRELKRLEARILERIAEQSAKGDAAQKAFGFVTARQFYGMDISPFACELAKVTMMIARKLAIDELHVTEHALPLDNLDNNFIVGDALISGTASGADVPSASGADILSASGADVPSASIAGVSPAMSPEGAQVGSRGRKPPESGEGNSSPEGATETQAALMDQASAAPSGLQSSGTTDRGLAPPATISRPSGPQSHPQAESTPLEGGTQTTAVNGADVPSASGADILSASGADVPSASIAGVSPAMSPEGAQVGSRGRKPPESGEGNSSPEGATETQAALMDQASAAPSGLQSSGTTDRGLTPPATISRPSGPQSHPQAESTPLEGATQTVWPRADAIIGNPPFLGSRFLAKERGYPYARAIHAAYPDIPQMADYCVHWLRKAHDRLAPCTPADPLTGRAGLVSTQNIRNNQSRVGGLDYIVKDGTIIEAVDNQPWSGEANVHVSIVNWVKTQEPALLPAKRKLWSKVNPPPGAKKIRKAGSGPATKEYELVAKECDFINSALSDSLPANEAKVLACNTHPKLCYQGQIPCHDGFLLSPNEANAMIAEDPSAKDVLFPYLVGRDLVADGKPTRWVIDFAQRDMLEAAKYKRPFQIVKEKVMPVVIAKAESEKKATGKESTRWTRLAERWWQFRDYQPGTLRSISGLPRYIVCSRVTKRPVFAFASSGIHPDSALIAFPLADDYSFGILQSAAHWLWFTTKCSKLTERFRYTPESVFDTFPWPQLPTAAQVEAVAATGREIRRIRAEALAEITGGLRALYRTLELPGANPLKDAHAALDTAVHAAYGFDAAKDRLAQLLALNLDVARRIERNEPVTAPGVPRTFPNPPRLVTEDSIGAT